MTRVSAPAQPIVASLESSVTPPVQGAPPRIPWHGMWIDAGPGPAIQASAASRWGALLYGVACYAMFHATYLYMTGFIIGVLTPTALDGPRVGPLWTAMLVNTGLVLLFAVQHSVMARPWFKSVWTRYVPQHLERSTYVLFSNIALIILMVFWMPLGGVIWDFTHPAAKAVMYGLFAIGAMILLASTFLINHFDLFGLRQVWHHFRGRASGPLDFATPGFYRHVRHPIYVGWLLMFWMTPTMTAAHLLFAVLSTVYILAAIRWEERDLVAAHPEYAEYRDRVPMLVPRLAKEP